MVLILNKRKRKMRLIWDYFCVFLSVVMYNVVQSKSLHPFVSFSLIKGAVWHTVIDLNVIFNPQTPLALLATKKAEVKERGGCM